MIEDKIKEILSSRVKDLGYHLIRVKLISVSGRKTLQIMAERITDRGMDIKDCTLLSKQISTFLDIEDPISSAFTLEVSSGGLARPLTSLEDYKVFKGNKIKITLKELYMGKKNYKGFIDEINEKGSIIINTLDHKMTIDFHEIEKSNIDLDWAISQYQLEV